jgi:hypothetical protein
MSLFFSEVEAWSGPRVLSSRLYLQDEIAIVHIATPCVIRKRNDTRFVA